VRKRQNLKEFAS